MKARHPVDPIIRFWRDRPRTYAAVSALGALGIAALYDDVAPWFGADPMGVWLRYSIGAIAAVVSYQFAAGWRRDAYEWARSHNA